MAKVLYSEQRLVKYTHSEPRKLSCLSSVLYVPTYLKHISAQPPPPQKKNVPSVSFHPIGQTTPLWLDKP